MKKHGFYAILLCLYVSLSGCTGSQSYQVPYGQSGKTLRIFVSDFDVRKNPYVGQDAGQAAAAMFLTALQRRGTFSPVDRSILKSVLEEQRFQLSDLVDPATAVRVGKIVGARYVVTGAVTEIGFQQASILISVTSCRVSIDVRIIDVETSRVVVAEVGQGRSSRGGLMFHEKFPDAVRKTSMEGWVSEALRHATEDAARKIN